ncbi:hypothetical protein EDEG_01766 [Edhazardia aedis USNM 41457]|uniref:Uncharacterized protein n=1 Tax=Edhazardia aedis (strain USNM 41457) TaxID=1003232 RepID=J9DN09_EDHAE|nr:hypothetical protein EDEG_01766 [Edhazardia aedis USNM 41457]|eukprot:EJW03940.1 hypothetical protein EDEG_01766 [Edhazardia aedis USNM 41457]
MSKMFKSVPIFTKMGIRCIILTFMIMLSFIVVILSLMLAKIRTDIKTSGNIGFYDRNLASSQFNVFGKNKSSFSIDTKNKTVIKSDPEKSFTYNLIILNITSEDPYPFILTYPNANLTIKLHINEIARAFDPNLFVTDIFNLYSDVYGSKLVFFKNLLNEDQPYNTDWIYDLKNNFGNPKILAMYFVLKGLYYDLKCLKKLNYADDSKLLYNFYDHSWHTIVKMLEKPKDPDLLKKSHDYDIVMKQIKIVEKRCDCIQSLVGVCSEDLTTFNKARACCIKDIEVYKKVFVEDHVNEPNFPKSCAIIAYACKKNL